MTECEKFLANGTLPEDFLKEEIRNDYTVSVEMKKIWAVSIDLLQKLFEVCNKHNLKVFAIGGTAIGAVRHKGFIPWDDDIDVAMPREDYNKLLSVAQAEFLEPYFLQTPLSDNSFYNRPFARLRNSNTTAISPCDEMLDCNNGLFIDIFPLDYYSDDFKSNFLIEKTKIQSATAWNKIHYKYVKGNKFIRTVLNLLSPIILCGNTVGFFKNNNKYCSRIKRSDYIGLQYSFFGMDKKKLIWPTKCFEQIVYLPFEHIKIPLPEGYDSMLKIEYGDYMAFPPRETWGKHHSIEFDADVPYRQYCSEHYGTKYK